MHTKPLTFQLPSPAAGADWSTRLSQTDQAVVMSVTATLTTSIAVANRRPAIAMLDQSGLMYFSADNAQPQAASLGVTYTWAKEAGGSLAAALAGGQRVANPYPNIWLQPGDTLESVTAAIDVADQWSNIVIRYYLGEHWRKLQAELRMQQEIDAAIAELSN